MATLIKACGEIKQVFPVDGSKKFTLEEVQRLVGGYIELVPLAYRKRGECPFLIVNEEGNLMHLPPNEEASFMARIILVGDVVHLTPDEWTETMESEDE